MPRDLPIACTLDATALHRRLETMAALGRDALVTGQVDGTQVTLRFAGRAGVRDRVDAIVDAESECCRFLTMHVREEPGAVVLRIDGPEGAEPVLTELVDAFTGGPARERAAAR
jgi:hypothetical protein